MINIYTSDEFVIALNWCLKYYGIKKDNPISLRNISNEFYEFVNEASNDFVFNINAIKPVFVLKFCDPSHETIFLLNTAK